MERVVPERKEVAFTSSLEDRKQKNPYILAPSLGFILLVTCKRYKKPFTPKVYIINPFLKFVVHIVGGLNHKLIMKSTKVLLYKKKEKIPSIV